MVAFPSSDSSYLWKKASQSTERQPRSAARAVLQALAVLHAGRPAPWPCCTANVRGSQTMRTMRTDLPGGLCTGQLSLGLSWTDVVRWFIGATCGVHACLGDSFPAVLPAPFAQTLRRHLSCTDKRQSPKLPNDQTQEADESDRMATVWCMRPAARDSKRQLLVSARATCAPMHHSPLVACGKKYLPQNFNTLDFFFCPYMH